jgi:hypothetical protein
MYEKQTSLFRVFLSVVLRVKHHCLISERSLRDQTLKGVTYKTEIPEIS